MDGGGSGAGAQDDGEGGEGGGVEEEVGEEGEGRSEGGAKGGVEEEGGSKGEEEEGGEVEDAFHGSLGGVVGVGVGAEDNVEADKDGGDVLREEEECGREKGREGEINEKE